MSAIWDARYWKVSLYNTFCGKILGDTLHNLKFDLGHILKWFRVNSLKPNSGKFQFMILGTNTDIKIMLFLDGNKIEKFQKVFLLRINIDDKAFKHILKVFVEQ